MAESSGVKSSILSMLFFLLLGLALVISLLLACGGGVGWLLHRFWPAIDLGTGVLIGVVATSMAGLIFVKTLGSMVREAIGFQTPVADSSLDEDDDDDDDGPPIYITNLPPEAARRYTPRKRARRRSR